MSSFGPQIPASLTKRKRDGKDEESQTSKHRRGDTNEDEIALDDSDDDDYGPSAPSAAKGAIGPSLPAAKRDEIDLDDSEDDYGPSAPAPAPSKPPSRSMGPARPQSNTEEIDLEESDSDTGPAPPKPPVGPTLPSAASRPDPDSSDSEDDYGPALPNSSNAAKRSIGPQLPPTEAAPQRDEWMLAPPESSAYAERDPTRMKNRKFASKSSSGPSTVSSIWTETPEEKLKRLQDAVLGREDKTQESSKETAMMKKEREQQQKIAANIKAQRGKSLYDEHQSRKEDAGEKVEEEDDPSKRGFDREKDMALGGKIGTSQRRELMNKAANFGGRFSKGSFL